MLEQKLFFTRNGEYTVWEKIQSLKESSLEEIIYYIKESLKINLGEDKYSNSSNKRILYTLCVSEEDETIKEILNSLIDQYFLRDNIEKSDFNALLFKLDLSYMDVDIGYRLLQKLKEKRNEYNIEKPQFDIFLRKNDDCIDIRLSTTKVNEYKDNSNEQFVNTEVRIYFDFGLILMTDYNDYTHIKSIKTKLINDIQALLTNTESKFEPYRLSDMALRVLLKKSKKYSSKFKFSIDGFIDVDFSVSENINDDPLQYDGLREFYDNHPISVIKISMSDNEDKYITVDGEKGKLISRSKNMEVKDIDEFIHLLRDVIKYDYLNNNYIKNIKDIAKRKLVGPSATKISKVESIYGQIEKKIKVYLGENIDPDSVAIIRNAFFYCLIMKIFKIECPDIKFEIDDEILGTLSKLLEINRDSINKLFNYIISLAINPNINDLLEALDEFISIKGELNVNQI